MVDLEPKHSIPVPFQQYRHRSLTNTSQMGVAPFTIFLTAGEKTRDAILLLGKRTHDPSKSFGQEIHLTQVLQWRGLKILQWLEEVSSYYGCVENFELPTVLRTPEGNGLKMLLSRPEGTYAFLFHLPSQFHSLLRRSPSQCPLRCTCPSLGQEQSWG